MPFSDLQISLDIATAVSVCGAVLAFLINGVKNRKAKQNEFVLEKISILVEFINEKAIEAIKIIESFEQQVSHKNIDIVLIQISEDWKSPYHLPKQVDCSDFVSKMSEKIIKPLYVHLRLYPYKNLISQKTQNVLSTGLKSIDPYVMDSHSNKHSILNDIFWSAALNKFSDFLIENKAVDPYESGFTEENHLNREIITFKQFEKLDERVKFDYKFAFLKEVQSKIIVHKDQWQEIPIVLENISKSLIDIQSF